MSGIFYDPANRSLHHVSDAPQRAADLTRDVEWTSSDPAVVTVNERGALLAVSDGAAVISARLSDGATVSQLDERFHEMLVEGTGNVEMAQMHHALTERIRIIRRLDFTKPPRIDATYTEHGKILRAVLQRRADQGQLLLKTHIEESKAEVRKITVHMLHTARRGPE